MKRVIVLFVSIALGGLALGFMPNSARDNSVMESFEGSLLGKTE